jgi:hypothetical protein
METVSTSVTTAKMQTIYIYTIQKRIFLYIEIAGTTAMQRNHKNFIFTTLCRSSAVKSFYHTTAVKYVIKSTML